MSLLLALLACTASDKDTTLTSDSGGDSAEPECGRVRGTPGVMLFQADDAVRASVDAPDATTDSHSVAGLGSLVMCFEKSTRMNRAIPSA